MVIRWPVMERAWWEARQTVSYLGQAYTFVRELTRTGGNVLFAGPKKAARDAIEAELTQGELESPPRGDLGDTAAGFAFDAELEEERELLGRRRRKGEDDVA